MTQSYSVTFTNGIRRDFLAHSRNQARDAAYTWLCAYQPHNVFIAMVSAGQPA